MRCCDGLPQQVWHHTSVLARRPFTVLLKILTRSSTSSLPNALPRTGTMWICGSSIWITGHPASASPLSSRLIALENAQVRSIGSL